MTNTPQKHMILNNRKISRDDYNIFLEGIHTAYGSQYGRITPNISRALRHFGQHLKNGDVDHITLLEKESHTSNRKSTRTVIFEPQPEEDKNEDSVQKE